MSKLFFLFAVFLLGLVSPSFSEDAAHADPVFAFLVIQDQFVFDSLTVKSAALIQKEGIFQGLHIQLKPAAAEQFTNMTKTEMGKPLNLVFNKKVLSTSLIQSPLSGDIQISGISLEDAQEFIASLNRNKPKPLQ